MAEQYYELLGVPSDATSDQIKSAYRDRLKETHPDVSDDADARSQTKRLIEAKEVLVDEDERARYDRLGHEEYVRIDRGEAVDDAGETTGSRAADTGASATARGTGRSGSTTAGGSGQASGGATGTRTGQASGGATGTRTGQASGGATGARTGRTTGRRAATDPEDIPWEDISAENVEGISDEVWEEITSESTDTSTSTPGHRQRRSAPESAVDGQTTGTRKNHGEASVGWYQADGDPSGSNHDSWSFGGDSVRDSPWPSWADPEEYTVSGGAPSVFGQSQRRALMGMIFVLYPLLATGTAFSGFGTMNRVLFGFILVFLVISLLVSPRYGMFVFGAWSVLFIPLLIIVDVSLAAPASLSVLALTLCGFGMSTFSWKIISKALS